MINLLSQITLFTWLFLASVILSLVVYFFKVDKKIIFFYARKNKPWALRAVNRLKDELEQRKLKDRQKRLDKYIQRAKELSQATNGKRYYVIPVYDDFVIVDSSRGKQWLKDNHFNSNVTLSGICAYYTPCTLLTENNNKESVVINWIEIAYDWLVRFFSRINFKM